MLYRIKATSREIRNVTSIIIFIFAVFKFVTRFFFFAVQHILVKPKVKGVEGDEDLPDEIVYVTLAQLSICFQ